VEPELTRPKVILLIVAVFLALVGFHLWLGRQEGNGTGEARDFRLSGIQMAERGEELDVSREMGPDEQEALILSRANLLMNGERGERRATAMQLSYMTADPDRVVKLLQLSSGTRERLREALFQRLRDEDELVSSACRNVLLGLWRSSDTTAATEQFRRAVALYERGQLDQALAALETAEKMRGSVPADLHRMKAQVYLAKTMIELALEECRLALDREKRNFYAWLVVARIHRQAGNPQRALEGLKAALDIYPRFAEARKLREEIAAAQDAERDISTSRSSVCRARPLSMACAAAATPARMSSALPPT
jgi:tetratricopeptide (TPR) repeat protein